MKSNYKRIGDFIRPIKVKNIDSSDKSLLGININKYFMPSVANVVGTDLSRYKIVKKGQFSCNRMHVGRDKRLPVALSNQENDFIVSPAYDVFEIFDKNILLPEYLMMWFSRKEFDRNAWFYTDADVRGGLHWDAFCNMQLPVPDIEKQKAIVKEYNTIVNRIKLNDLCSLITDGKHGDCKDEKKSGFFFVSVKDLANGSINFSNARQITRVDFEETHKRTDFTVGDILFTNSGTIGRMAIAKDMPETRKTTFQKSVAILKPKKGMVKSYFLYSLLKYNLKNIQELASGTSQSNLLLGSFRAFIITYPGFELICKFEEIITPIFYNIHIKVQQNKHLIELRDVILSKMTKV